MKENEKKAFDFAADVTKQLITLSTAIITITITFSKDIINFADNSAKNYLLLAWILFIATVFFGIWTLMALTGTLQPMKKDSNQIQSQDNTEANTNVTPTAPQNNSVDSNCSINTGNIRIPSILQILCFIMALSFTITYGYKSLNNTKTDINEQTNENELRIIRKIEYTVKPDSTIDTMIVK
jgi:hypothetical protein